VSMVRGSAIAAAQTTMRPVESSHSSIRSTVSAILASLMLLAGLWTILSPEAASWVPQAGKKTPQAGNWPPQTRLSETQVPGCGAYWNVVDVQQSPAPVVGITQANRFLSITHGASQVAVLYLDSGYLRLKPGAMSQEGTSNILLPILWTESGRFQVSHSDYSYMNYTLSAPSSDVGACTIALSGAQTALNGISSSLTVTLSVRESDGATIAAVSVATAGALESPLTMDPTVQSGINVQLAAFSSMNVGRDSTADSEAACVTGATPYCFDFTSWFARGGLASSAQNWGHVWSNSDPGFGYVTLKGQPHEWYDDHQMPQQPRPTVMLSEFDCSGCSDGWGTDGWIDNSPLITSDSDNVAWWVGAIRADSMPTAWSYTITATQPSA